MNPLAAAAGIGGMTTYPNNNNNRNSTTNNNPYPPYNKPHSYQNQQQQYNMGRIQHQQYQAPQLPVQNDNFDNFDDDDDEFAHLDLDLNEDGIRELQEKEMEILSQMNFWPNKPGANVMNIDNNNNNNKAHSSKMDVDDTSFDFMLRDDTVDDMDDILNAIEINEQGEVVTAPQQQQQQQQQLPQPQLQQTQLQSQPQRPAFHHSFTSPKPKLTPVNSRFGNATRPLSTTNSPHVHHRPPQPQPQPVQSQPSQPPPPTTTSTTEITQLQSRIAQVSTQLQQYKRENEALMSSTFQKDGEISIIRNKIIKMETENLALKEALMTQTRLASESKEEEKLELKREIERLKTELEFKSHEVQELALSKTMSHQNHLSQPQPQPFPSSATNSPRNPKSSKKGSSFPSLSSFHDDIGIKPPPVVKKPTKSIAIMTDLLNDPIRQQENNAAPTIVEKVIEVVKPVRKPVVVSRVRSAVYGMRGLGMNHSLFVQNLLHEFPYLSSSTRFITDKSMTFEQVFELFPFEPQAATEQPNPRQLPTLLRQLSSELSSALTSLVFLNTPLGTNPHHSYLLLLTCLEKFLEIAIESQFWDRVAIGLRVLNLMICTDSDVICRAVCGEGVNAPGNVAGILDLLFKVWGLPPAILSQCPNSVTISVAKSQKTLFETIFTVLTNFVQSIHDVRHRMALFGKFVTAKACHRFWDLRAPSQDVWQMSLAFVTHLLESPIVYKTLLTPVGRDKKQILLHRLVAGLGDTSKVEHFDSPTYQPYAMFKIRIIRFLSNLVSVWPGSMDVLMKSNQMMYRIVLSLHTELDVSRGRITPLLLETLSLLYYLFMRAPTIPTSLESVYGTFHFFMNVMSRLAFLDPPSYGNNMEEYDSSKTGVKEMAKDLLEFVVPPGEEVVVEGVFN